MSPRINMKGIYIPSSDIVSREVEGEIIIVPIVSGVGDMEEGLFSLNNTGKAIWKRLDGKNNVKSIIEALKEIFEAEEGEIEKDVKGFLYELLNRKIIVEKRN